VTDRPRPVADAGPQPVDLLPDEMAHGRALLASGLAGVAEGVLQRRITALEMAGKGGLEELDTARALLAEAFWRQGRPISAGAALESVRAASVERRRPLLMLIEAEALAAAGDTDRAAKAAERVIAAVGVDEAWRLRGGIASRLAWPTPASFRAPTPPTPASAGSVASTAINPERATTAHARLEMARRAYLDMQRDDGDRHLVAALRLDPRLGSAALAMFEPTLEKEPAEERLLLYGDLLRSAGREEDAAAAFDRAARG
jgi:tetratricopeptide (TPR) repeat protein